MAYALIGPQPVTSSAGVSYRQGDASERWRAICDCHRLAAGFGPVDPLASNEGPDRRAPDILAYAALFGFEFPPGENAAHLYRYRPHVFIALAWEQIYWTDDERTLPFSRAGEFGNSVRAIYERFGYTLIDLPCAGVEERADFILRHLRDA